MFPLAKDAPDHGKLPAIVQAGRRKFIAAVNRWGERILARRRAGLPSTPICWVAAEIAQLQPATGAIGMSLHAADNACFRCMSRANPAWYSDGRKTS